MRFYNNQRRIKLFDSFFICIGWTFLQEFMVPASLWCARRGCVFLDLLFGFGRGLLVSQWGGCWVGRLISDFEFFSDGHSLI